MTYSMRNYYLEASKLVGDLTDLQIIQRKLSITFKEQAVTRVHHNHQQYEIWPILTGRVNGHRCYLLLIDTEHCEQTSLTAKSTVIFIAPIQNVILTNTPEVTSELIKAYLKTTSMTLELQIETEYICSEGVLIKHRSDEGYYNQKYARYEVAMSALLNHCAAQELLSGYIEYFECSVFCSKDNVYIEYMNVERL